MGNKNYEKIGGIEANELDSNIVVRKLMSSDYVHFKTNSIVMR